MFHFSRLAADTLGMLLDKGESGRVDPSRGWVFTSTEKGEKGVAPSISIGDTGAAGVGMPLDAELS